MRQNTQEPSRGATPIERERDRERQRACMYVLVQSTDKLCNSPPLSFGVLIADRRVSSRRVGVIIILSLVIFTGIVPPRFRPKRHGTVYPGLTPEFAWTHANFSSSHRPGAWASGSVPLLKHTLLEHTGQQPPLCRDSRSGQTRWMPVFPRRSRWKPGSRCRNRQTHCGQSVRILDILRGDKLEFTSFRGRANRGANA